MPHNVKASRGARALARKNHAQRLFAIPAHGTKRFEVPNAPVQGTALIFVWKGVGKIRPRAPPGPLPKTGRGFLHIAPFGE